MTGALLERGKAFVALGNAMQDEKSSMELLSALALACGLTIQFRLTHADDVEPDSASLSQEKP